MGGRWPSIRKVFERRQRRWGELGGLLSRGPTLQDYVGVEEDRRMKKRNGGTRGPRARGGSSAERTPDDA